LIVTQSPTPSPESDPATLALAAALPEIRSVKTKGWLFCLMSVLVTIGILVLIANAAKGEKLEAVIYACIPALFGVIATVGWVRRRHERAVMPIIAQAFGLGYQKAPQDFYPTLPKNFIPQGGRRSVDDLMSGSIAGRSFRFAECKTETGGKNSSTLFKGIVLEVRSSGTMPEFLIASEKETKGFLFFKGKVQVEGMVMIHQSLGHDNQTYGLWARTESPRQMAGLRAFMDQIIALGPRVLGNSTLYSLVSTGSHYYVSLRHARDMYRIGGLFTNEAEVMQHIRAASSELSHPMDLVTEVLRAEEALLAAK
jgi:hypothetical protein